MTCVLEGFYQTNALYQTIHSVMSGVMPCWLATCLLYTSDAADE